MRQLLRITATFALALVFTAGMAFGQQVVNNQSGNATADIQQAIPSGYTTPHTVQGNNSRGSNPVNGSGIDAFDQAAGSKLEATQVSGSGGVRSQLKGDQLDGAQEMYVQQRFGANEAEIAQLFGSGNLVKLRQKGGGGSGAFAEISQQGDNNVVTGLDGSNNQLDGGIAVWTGDTHTGNGNGLYSASQKAGDQATIRQRLGNNKARFAQEGGNRIAINQFDGSVLEAYQNGTDNTISGNNQFVQPFEQRSSELYVTQTGNNNTVLGAQKVDNSAAYVNQTGGDNNAVINSIVQ